MLLDVQYVLPEVIFVADKIYQHTQLKMLVLRVLKSLGILVLNMRVMLS